MIRINLAIRPGPIRWLPIGLAAAAGAALVGLAVYGSARVGQYRRAGAALAEARALADGYRGQAGQLSELKRRQEVATAQEAALLALRRNQGAVAQSAVLDLLFRFAPGDVFLREVRFLPDDIVEVTGDARFDAVGTYVGRLRTAEILIEMEEKRLSSGAAGETIFTLRGKVRR